LVTGKLDVRAAAEIDAVPSDGIFEGETPTGDDEGEEGDASLNNPD
jgi:hypothetical protein